MTRWHTDAPVPPVSSVAGLASPAATSMFRADRAARTSFRVAQAFYRGRLRTWAKTHPRPLEPPEDEPSDGFVV